MVDDEAPVPIILVLLLTPVPKTLEDETAVLRTMLEEALVVEMRVLEGLVEVLNEDGLAEEVLTGTVPTVLMETPDALGGRDGPRGKHLLMGVIKWSLS